MADFSLYELLADAAPIEIVDVGAFDLVSHPPPYAALVQAGRARLIGFEPYPQGATQLMLKYGPPHRFLPLFIGAGGPAKFHATNRAWTGSLYPPNEPLLAAFNLLGETTPIGVHDVSTVRLDDVGEIADADFLKIDVQGAELDVLKGADKLLASAVMVQTETQFVELYRGVSLFGDIDTHLRGRGFWFHTFRDIGRFDAGVPAAAGQPPNQILWADAVYIREPFDLTALSDAKLAKLAILLHDLYGSHDLAHLCLKALDGRHGRAVAPAYLARVRPA
jgi:FkbM family methyltransferase